jgi:hypothetical protein
VSPTPPPALKRAIRDVSIARISLDATGVGSAEKAIERISAARSKATRESNRFLLVSLLFGILYLVKIAGLRADIVIMDQKVFEVPYGVFIFCICSLFAFCLSCIRSSDARVYDRYLMGICDKAWPTQAQSMYQTIPNDDIWLAPSSESIHALTENSFSKSLFVCFSIPTYLAGFFILLLPILSGFYFLIKWKELISLGNIHVQYYSVLFFTIISCMWFINGILIHVVDNDD